MLYFPQLESGALGQFPGRKRRLERTVVNELGDGRRVKIGDPAESRVEWTLIYEDLTESETAAIAGLHQACEGRLRTFTFLDPTDNLLVYSEELNADVWRKDPLLALQSGRVDPMGTSRATRITNTAQAAQWIDQSFTAPEGHQYCLSFHARSDYTGELITYRTAGGLDGRRVHTVGPSWKRIVTSTRLTRLNETATFGLELPAGRSVDVFGLQVEAQAGASQYKATTARGGVYEKARFMDDSLAVVAQDVNRYSCRVRVVARREN